jgi:hypothetical protein
VGRIVRIVGGQDSQERGWAGSWVGRIMGGQERGWAGAWVGRSVGGQERGWAGEGA